jgi:hypothetical protein
MRFMQLFLITHPALNERDQVQEIHKCLKGFVFLGTDHYNWPGTRGSIEQIAAAAAPAIAWAMLDAKSAFADLEEFQSQSPRINHDFAFRGGENFPMACFYETRVSSTLPLMRKVNSTSSQQRQSMRDRSSIWSQNVSEFFSPSLV